MTFKHTSPTHSLSLQNSLKIPFLNPYPFLSPALFRPQSRPPLYHTSRLLRVCICASVRARVWACGRSPCATPPCCGFLIVVRTCGFIFYTSSSESGAGSHQQTSFPESLLGVVKFSAKRELRLCRTCGGSLGLGSFTASSRRFLAIHQ